ncbi:MAG: hypothetical protein J5J06_18900 [Phycisphaerae bacterium]|nr:hypothetical protein [Phycisphaerae bacterium]
MPRYPCSRTFPRRPYLLPGILLLVSVVGVSATPPEPAAVEARKRAEADAEQAKRDKSFAESMKGVTLEGVWQMTAEGGLNSREPLTEPKAERYEIAEATKVVDDQWIINARIEVGDKDVTIPVPVRIVWAGDTPIITVDRVPVPTMGTYSARVMIFRGFYSGTWVNDEKQYGGVMAGRVLRQTDTAGKTDAADTKTKSSKEPAGSR